MRNDGIASHLRQEAARLRHHRSGLLVALIAIGLFAAACSGSDEGGADLLGSQGLRIGLSGFHDGIGMGGTSATGARLSIGFTF